MRLALKIFVARLLVILVVAGMAFWSLTEVVQLLTADRDITARTTSALRIEASFRASLRRARTLVPRFVVFGDREHAARQPWWVVAVGGPVVGVLASLTGTAAIAAGPTRSLRRLRAGTAALADSSFDRHRQAPTGRGGEPGPSCCAMVETHDGRVAVESREGAGSRFSAYPPRAPRPAATA